MRGAAWTNLRQRRPELLRHFQELAADHLEVIAGDKTEANLGLDQQTWQRLADTVDLIVDSAALVNGVLPYSELFGPNVVGHRRADPDRADHKLKPYAYVSTANVGDQSTVGVHRGRRHPGHQPHPHHRRSYSNGYGNSKWAGEVLLREANDLCGLPVAVFRCDMILADTTYAGQLNVSDMFTRMVLSVLATGVAPGSFTTRRRRQSATRALRRAPSRIRRRGDRHAGAKWSTGSRPTT